MNIQYITILLLFFIVSHFIVTESGFGIGVLFKTGLTDVAWFCDSSIKESSYIAIVVRLMVTPKSTIESTMVSHSVGFSYT